MYDHVCKSYGGRGHCEICGRHMQHRGFQGAFDKGFRSLRDGSECPYEDRRGGKYNHQVTWSRAYIRAWHTGRNYARSVLGKN